jgi:2,4-dichlorophenol 6-monooxygenase
VWLVDSSGLKVSTLDVTGKGEFTLVTGVSGGAWVAAVDKLDLPFLRAVVIGVDGARDSYGDWRRTSEIDEAGAILVRPDGYVAWRHVSAASGDEAFYLLQDTVDSVLDR